MEDKFDQIVQEVSCFKDIITKRVQELKQGKVDMLTSLKKELEEVQNEKASLLAEKKAWLHEKEQIAKIQPLSDIIKLNIGGKEEQMIRRSTLCSVPGSALEAMFSGRHSLQKVDDKVFVDRNPVAFNFMIDFIRNNGELYEQ